jgi:hypothetical protein
MGHLSDVVGSDAISRSVAKCKVPHTAKSNVAPLSSAVSNTASLAQDRGLRAHVGDLPLLDDGALVSDQSARMKKAGARLFRGRLLLG